VLVTCIFLNKTPADRAGPILAVFFQRYPNPRSLQAATVDDIKSYFKTLGLPGRATWIKTMAEQLLLDSPKPNRLRHKTYKNAGYASEVAHLKGIGDYGSDAWRLFCKEDFYARHNIVVTDEWKRVQTKDKALQKYIDRRWREIDIASQFSTLQISKDKKKQEGVWVGNHPYAMFVPKRFIDAARDHATNRKTSSKQQNIATGYGR
jgi:hypothetical protein